MNGGRRICRGVKIWNFYSGKSGIGRIVQTSFLFYGGLTTFLLTSFAVHFNVFDGTLGAPWLATCLLLVLTDPGREYLFWVCQILAVGFWRRPR